MKFWRKEESDVHTVKIHEAEIPARNSTNTNEIITSKYGIISFLPLCLIEQLSIFFFSNQAQRITRVHRI